ncbi:MAG: hypothetical protein HRJ53_06760 [Acidobacteria bacterium Pan2503]|uniref:Uncharacterized protein n=1 Tax=Candidatus Acidiferrum panamense TaxID=2741543 RepID=A0A7V8SWI6_9BACT|nr:hypothetical protein [Candidatus Acidoferrum panamensis]
MKEPDWKACANRHLLAHVMKQAGRKTYYVHPVDCMRMGPAREPHPLTVELTNTLLKYAHCWALDMADWPGGPPNAAEQREAWTRAMEDADRECRKIRLRGEKVADNTLLAEETLPL